MSSTTPKKHPIPAHRALCEIRREIAGIDKIITRREAEVASKREERDRLVATGRVDDPKILAQISAHDIQLSMFPHLLKNLEEQKTPLRAQYGALRAEIHTAALQILDEITNGLRESIEASVGIYCGGPRLRQQVTSAYGAETPAAHFFNLAVESVFKHSEIGIAILQLRAAIPPSSIVTEGDADTWILWGSELISLHGEWSAFIEDAERIEPKNAA